MKILLAGGGTGGPVSPILAVAAEIKKLKPETEFLFVGARKGPERQMVTEVGIAFKSVPAAKWRRYFTLLNLLSPFIFVAGLIKSFFIIRKFRPDVTFTAGGFVGVPVCWVANLFGSRIVVHQQDAQVGLANRLVSPIADKITTAFEDTSKQFTSGSGLFPDKLKPSAEWVGNPVRKQLFISKTDTKKYFILNDQLPILLVLGGATGSIQINKMLGEILPELVKSHQVVHQTGKGKNKLKFTDVNYHPYELIPFDAYAAIFQAAHLVACRAGLSTIAELSAAGKVAIVIPMPKTHQEENGKVLIEAGAAAVMMGTDVNSSKLLHVINQLKFDQKLNKIFSENMSKLIPKDAAEKLAKIILN